MDKINPSFYYCLIARGFYHLSCSLDIERVASGFGTFKGVKTSAWEKVGGSQGIRLDEVFSGYLKWILD